MVPNQTNEITQEWLNERLAADASVGEIASIEHEPMGAGVGILGELARLHLTYAEGHDGPATMIAKCQSAFPENIGLSQMMGFYVREISFYQQVAADLPVRVPAPYVADMEPGGAPFVLVLEDIAGARMIDQLVGATREDCERVFDAVSSLHAAYWDTDVLRELEWLPPMNNDLYKGAQALGEANWDAFVELWGDKVPARTLGWVERTTPVYPAMLDWWVEQGHQTFTHTDCRAENYLFGGSAGDDVTTVIDFQLSTRHIGAWDVANFLGASVSIENRRAWQDELLVTYHSMLMAKGVTADYTLERCRRDYRYCLLQQAWAQLAVATLDPGNDRGRALLNEFVTRSFQAAEDNDAGELLDIL